MKKQYFQSGYIRKDIYQDSYEFLTADTIDEIFTCISRILCYSDCDDTFRIVDIFCHGKKVEYVGWQPDMHFEFRYVDNNELAWEGWFPNWEH